MQTIDNRAADNVNLKINVAAWSFIHAVMRSDMRISSPYINNEQQQIIEPIIFMYSH